jgi:outer membrane protein OmpA-like peptidoglycan-associated protein/thiol-disulfide isomerase/thioredoxin
MGTIEGVAQRAVLVLCGLLALSSRVDASELDVAAWLQRPGVKLLVVEFYATWCEPCMRAVPKWRALHEKHRDDGLRLVVVATRDPEGGCTNPGWNPDSVVCDDDGRLADRFGATTLPAAFLWSWQGNLLVRRGHAEDVERRVVDWMRASPRIAVGVKQVAQGSGIRDVELLDLVRSRVREDDKVVVLATEEERRRLLEIKKQSYGASYDDARQCELGVELSANSVLDVAITGADRKRLQLNLLSAELGCLVASSVVDWQPRKAGVSVAEAVGKLFEQLRTKPELPGGSTASGDDEYEALAREAAAAKASRDELDRAWTAVKAFAATPTIDVERRKAAVEKFLRDYPRNNGYAAEAEALLASFTPAPKKGDASDRDQSSPEGRLDIAFEFNKTKILPASFATVGRVADWMKAQPGVRVRIEGHTDSQGSDGANLKLSQGRADAVRALLIEVGVEPSRIEAIGYGEQRPIASNATAEGRQQNRRIELTVLTGEAERPTSPVVTGSLDKDAIQRVIRGHVAEIRYCYEKQLLRKPGLEGKVTAELVISTTGAVQSARIADTTLHDAEVEGCIVTTIRRWQFPKPKGGSVVVKYPFVFRAPG